MHPTTHGRVPQDVAPPVLSRRVLVATLIGNFTEWFDFAVYGAVAVTLGRVLLPLEDPAVSLLASLAAFAVAFVLRPVGGALLGSVGDRYGRRIALSVAVLGISVATTSIALLPSYATAGLWAPFLLVLLRCVQGLSAGGEWTSASAFLVEYAPANRRGLGASLISVSGGVAVVAGIVTSLALESALTPAQMQAWGWRLPFLLAAPLGLVGLYLRLRLDETPVYRELRARGSVTTTPLRDAVRTSPGTLAVAFACARATGVGFYYLATYFVNALSAGQGGRTTGPDPQRGRAAGLHRAVPAGGPAVRPVRSAPGLHRRLPGSRGPRRPGAPARLVGNTGAALLGLCLFAVPQAALNVMSSVTLVELFPAQTRSSGAALAYSLGVGPIAGSAPLVATALAAATGTPLAPAGYLAAITLVVALVLVRHLPETRHRSLSTAPDLSS